MPASPFTQETLNPIFRLSPKDTNRLVSREGYSLEFKRSFSWGSRASYARTFLAFANTRGGYMVFGVNPKPHTLIGLQDRRFEERDPATIDEFLCECADPTIEWDATVYTFGERVFGLIYVHESPIKPVICKKSFGETLVDGDIYYRYKARTRKIRFAELRMMIDRVRESETTAWLDLMRHVSRIGVRDAGIFDPASGEVQGTGGSFIIDEALLPKLSYISERTPPESTGDPAVRIVGDAKAVRTVYVSSGKEIVRTQGIRAPTIILDFLNAKKVDNPAEYVRQICFESTAHLPVYYYMQQAHLSTQAALKLLQDVRSTSQAKKKLIKRLQRGDRFSLAMPSSSTSAGQEKLGFRKRLLSMEPGLAQSVSPEKARYLLQAVRTLESSQLSKRYIAPELLSLFERFYGKEDPQITYELRDAICFLDATWHVPEGSG